jgi:hypothetical protein
MSLLDTYKTYNPVTVAVGCMFVGAGFWLLFELVRHGARTTAGIFVIVLLAALPISVGAATIHNQLQLRRNARRS